MAEYAERMPMRPWKPRSPAQAGLHQVMVARRRYVHSIGDFHRLRQSGSVDRLSETLQNTLHTRQQQLGALERRIEAMVAGNETLSPAVARLTSIPGIGPSRAWFLMAEVDIHDFERAKQLAAYLGVTPHARPATVAAQPG